MGILGDFCDILSGFPFESKFFNAEKGIPIVRIRDVKNGYSKTYYNGDYDKKFIIKYGDILIGMDGEFNIKEWKSNDALLNQRVCKIFTTNKSINLKYIYYFLSISLKKIEDITPFVTVKHLSIKDIKNINIILPTFDEQKRIAAILDKATELIALRKQQIQKLDLLMKSQFIEMFGNPIKNDRSWDIKELGELGELNRGISKHRPRNAPELLGGNYPLIQTGEIAAAQLYVTKYTSTYSEIGYQQSKMWPKGTLCITIAANIAKTAILKFDACFPDSVVGFISNHKTNQLFIHFWFSFFQRILEEQAPESAQKNINLQILRALQVIIPPLSLQNEFAAFVEQVDKTKSTLQQSLEKLELNYKSLMQTYFG